MVQNQIVNFPWSLEEIKVKGDETTLKIKLNRVPAELESLGYKVILSVDTTEMDMEIKSFENQIFEAKQNADSKLIGTKEVIDQLKNNIKGINRLKDLLREENPNIEFNVGKIAEYKETKGDAVIRFYISNETAVMLINLIIDLNKYFISLIPHTIDGTTSQQVQPGSMSRDLHLPMKGENEME